MQVLFESRDPDGAQWREVAVRRLRFVLRRLTWLVPRARVQLSDVNGPRGGVDKQCRVELKTASAGTVVDHLDGARLARRAGHGAGALGTHAGARLATRPPAASRGCAPLCER